MEKNGVNDFQDLLFCIIGIIALTCKILRNTQGSTGIES